MKYFQTQFSHLNNYTVNHNGITYHRFWTVQVNSHLRLKLRFLQSNSELNQAIVLFFPENFDGNVLVMGKEFSIRKSQFPKIIFWEDDLPSEFDVSIANYFGEIFVCNGADPLGNKQLCKHLSEGCAMIIEMINERKFTFYCNNHKYEGTCNDFIFEAEIMEQKTGDGLCEPF